MSGIGGPLTDALQRATAGLSNWLKAYYRLDSAEVATVLATSMHYDVAEIVAAEFHIVARLDKQTLSQIAKPPAPATVFCQAPGDALATS